MKPVDPRGYRRTLQNMASKQDPRIERSEKARYTLQTGKEVQGHDKLKA